MSDFGTEEDKMGLLFNGCMVYIYAYMMERIIVMESDSGNTTEYIFLYYQN